MHSEELESLLVPATESPIESSIHSPIESSIHPPIESSIHPPSHLHSYGMIGLHCCGDLSASICRMFVESGDRCRLLAFVGCCYNLLTTRESKTEGIFGFPLNPEVTVRMEQRVRNAIVQVCFFLVVCKEQNTQFDSVEAFQSCVTRLFYRTLLQVIICTSFPTEFLLFWWVHK